MAVVLKQYRGGRVRVPRQRREALLDEFERSGTTGASFARLVGMKYATFAGWVQNRRKMLGRPAKTPCQEDTAAKPRRAVRLFEAVVESGGDAVGPQATPALPGPQAGGLLIELPGGSLMRVETPTLLQLAAELLALMTQRTRARC